MGGVAKQQRLWQRLWVAPLYPTFPHFQQHPLFSDGHRPLTLKSTLLSLSFSYLWHEAKFWPIGYTQSDKCDLQKVFKGEEYRPLLPFTFLQTGGQTWWLGLHRPPCTWWKLCLASLICLKQLSCLLWSSLTRLQNKLLISLCHSFYFKPNYNFYIHKYTKAF